MEKDKKFVKELKEIIVNKAKQEFNYVGIAEGERFITINTGDKIIIEIHDLFL